MALSITSVTPHSLAARAGIVGGDVIESVNGMPINDFFDLEFYSSDYSLEFVIKNKNNQSNIVTIYRELTIPLGIEPSEYKHRNCMNNCVFCFIDQMPPNLRNTLYKKDDDYLFSFVFGNYITLSNLTDEDYKRIKNQRISPLYISLHATNKDIRQSMMRSANPIDPLQALQKLAKSKISYHIQIVCVPDFNDKEVLRNTICTLLDAKLPVLSIGIVPVGLTKYRERLYPIKGFNQELAITTLDLIEEIRNKYSSTIIYPADELFVLAERDIPDCSYYDDFPQLENGIGMLRLTLENYKQNKRKFVNALRKKAGDYLFLCSRSAKQMISYICADLSLKLKDRSISYLVVANDYFGPMVSVAGLITFDDLASQVPLSSNSILVLPNSMFNHDGYTIDGMSHSDIKAHFQRDILVVDQLFEDWDWM